MAANTSNRFPWTTSECLKGSRFPVLSDCDGSVVVEPIKFNLREEEATLIVDKSHVTLSEMSSSSISAKPRLSLLNDCNAESITCSSFAYTLQIDPLESPLRNLFTAFGWDNDQNTKDIEQSIDVKNVTNKKNPNDIVSRNAGAFNESNNDRPSKTAEFSQVPRKIPIDPEPLVALNKVLDNQFKSENYVSQTRAVEESISIPYAPQMDWPGQHRKLASKELKMQDVKIDSDNGVVIALISKQSMKREISVVQDKALAVLNLHNIPCVVIDGADPTLKDQRNELFEISGLRGKYPQFFLQSKEGLVKFWGDWEKFEFANENGTIQQELHNSKQNSSMSTGENVESVISSDAVDLIYDTQMSVMKGKVLVLCSYQSFKREVTANQEKAFTVMKGKNIEYETIDGAEVANKDRRNELFGLSGIRGEYPQFFIMKTDDQENCSFWGCWERFHESNEKGTLLHDLFGS